MAEVLEVAGKRLMTASAPRAPPPSPPITTRAPMSMVRAVGRPPRGDAEDGGTGELTGDALLGSAIIS